MVCRRCKMAVAAELHKAGLNALSVELGEIELEQAPSKQQLLTLGYSLNQLGFELIDDKKSRIIENIKTSIISLIHHTTDKMQVNLSAYLANKLRYDYTYLSNLFSEVEGTTIEKYFIAQRIEKVKELLVYDELSLSQIADRLGYSSVAYLSGQFKKVTGLTPSYYKLPGGHKRKNIEEL